MTAMNAASGNDRFTTMLFVAALFHAVLILGISFSDGTPFDSDVSATSMEVVLLTREFEKATDNPDADYLAQQNLAGAGNTAEDDGVRVAYGREAAPPVPGPEQDGADMQQQRRDQQNTSDQQLFARTPDSAALAEREREAREALDARTGLPGDANSVELLAAPDSRTRVQGARPRELIVSANTRESRIASYLDGWKRRVERVGTMNFPRSAATVPGQRNPVLEVSILASGELRQVLILDTSGNRELDMAAVDILKLASPFDPFPEYLRNDYDALKFSYEWQFSAGTVGRMRVP